MILDEHETLAFRSFGPGVGAGVDALEAGAADFEAGPGGLEAGPPAGGLDDFLFSPGFAAWDGDGAEAAVAAAAKRKIRYRIINLR